MLAKLGDAAISPSTETTKIFSLNRGTYCRISLRSETFTAGELGVFGGKYQRGKPLARLYKRPPPCHSARFMSILINVLIAFHVLICLLMVVVVLMQRPKNEGLGAAFGGGMTENIFGAQTTHVLQKFTVWLGIVFFALTLLLAILYAKRGTGETSIQKELLSQPVPAAAAAPEAAPAATPIVATTEPVAVEAVAVEAVETPSAPAAEAPDASTEPAAAPAPAGN